MVHDAVTSATAKANIMQHPQRSGKSKVSITAMHCVFGRAVSGLWHDALLSPEKCFTVNVTFCIAFAAIPKHACAVLLLRHLSEPLEVDKGAWAVDSCRLYCVSLCSKAPY